MATKRRTTKKKATRKKAPKKKTTAQKARLFAAMADRVEEQNPSIVEDLIEEVEQAIGQWESEYAYVPQKVLDYVRRQYIKM